MTGDWSPTTCQEAYLSASPPDGVSSKKWARDTPLLHSKGKGHGCAVTDWLVAYRKQFDAGLCLTAGVDAASNTGNLAYGMMSGPLWEDRFRRGMRSSGTHDTYLRSIRCAYIALVLPASHWRRLYRWRFLHWQYQAS